MNSYKMRLTLVAGACALLTACSGGQHSDTVHDNDFASTETDAIIEGENTPTENTDYKKVIMEEKDHLYTGYKIENKATSYTELENQIDKINELSR